MICLLLSLFCLTNYDFLVVKVEQSYILIVLLVKIYSKSKPNLIFV